MFGGGPGGLNPRKMQQMMKQMGIEMDELDVEEVVIRTADGEELVFSSPDVTKMEARGQSTYQVVGDPKTRDAGDAGEATVSDDEDDTDDASVDIPDADVEIVAERTGVSADEARAALEETGGDLAAAIQQLE